MACPRKSPPPALQAFLFAEMQASTCKFSRSESWMQASCAYSNQPATPASPQRISHARRHASLQLLAQRQAARPLHAPPEAAQATPVPLPADHAAPQPPYLSLAPGLPLTSRLLESRISFQQTKRPSQRLGRFRPYMQTRSGRQHQATASSGCSNGWW